MLVKGTHVAARHPDRAGAIVADAVVSQVGIALVENLARTPVVDVAEQGYTFLLRRRLRGHGIEFNAFDHPDQENHAILVSGMGIGGRQTHDELAVGEAHDFTLDRPSVFEANGVGASRESAYQGKKDRPENEPPIAVLSSHLPLSSLRTEPMLTDALDAPRSLEVASPLTPRTAYSPEAQGSTHAPTALFAMQWLS